MVVDLEFLKQSLPEYKVIDISVINDFSHLAEVTKRTKPNVVLVSFRTAGNSNVWSILDEWDKHTETETSLPIRRHPDCRLWNKDDYLYFFQDNPRDNNLKIIRLWLQSETKNNCYICTEAIKMYGILCPVCWKAPCSNCFNKMLKTGNIKCPLCRSQVTKMKE